MTNNNNTYLLGKGNLLLSILMGCLSLGAHAQFSLSGEVRPRTEYRHGFTSLPAKDQNYALFTDQRSRLTAAYKAEGFETFIQIQDIRTWGSTSQLNSTDGFLSMHQAWGIARFNEKIGLKFGRQEIILDDHRIFGSVDWAQQARSHDAAVFQYTDSTFTLNFGAAYNQNSPQLTNNLYSVPKNYKAMQYLWLHKDFSKNFGMSILALNNGVQATKTDTAGVTEGKINYSQTVGTRLSYKSDKLTVNGNFYYQMGDDGAWDPTSIAAYNLGVDATYKITDPLQVVLGYELLSGTSQTDTANKNNNSFNPFYGTNHKFNGLMDYFYVGNHTNSVGLQDVYLKLQYNHTKFNIGVDAHMFSAAAEILDVEKLTTTGTYSGMNTNLGTEIDTYFGFKLTKGVALKGGYSQMLGTKSMEALKGGDKGEMANWAWAMIVIKPSFIGGK